MVELIGANLELTAPTRPAVREKEKEREIATGSKYMMSRALFSREEEGEEA